MTMKSSNVVPIRSPRAPAQVRPSTAGKPKRRLKVNVYRMVILVAIIYFIITFINQQIVLLELEKQLARLEVEIEAVNQEKMELRSRLQYLQSNEFIQEEARTRFGLAMPGEIQYVTLDREDEESQE